MHWTAFLAYRRFTENARVADDLPCINCGYNLRSLPARANCSECGRPVGDSLFVLAQPHIVGNALKSIGGTFFGILAIFLPCLNLNAAWPPIVAMGILATCAAVRVMSVWELRTRGAIHSLPVIGPRLRTLQIVSAADFAGAAASCALLWLAESIVSPGAMMEKVAGTVVVVWFVLYLASAFCAGFLGSAIAVMLAYFLSRWEFILHRAALVAGACGLLIVLGIHLSGAGTTPLMVWSVISALVIIASMVLLALGLIHLGGGAEHETETWEDVLEHDEA